MKITSVTGIALRVPCAPIADALSTSTARQALLVRIDTDAGLFGIGEAFSFGAPLAAMKAILEAQLAPSLIGEDPQDIERIWQTLYWRTIANGRRSLTMACISGIDIALWDLMGKACRMPVCRLLGAYSDRVPSYASGGFYAPGKDLDGLRREIEGYLSRGYRDAKIKIGRTMDRPGAPLSYMANRDWAVTPEEDFRRIAAAKELLGDGLLIVDSNASWDSYIALSRGRELARLGVEWLEEPIPFEDLEGYTRISRELPQLRIIGCETQQGADNFATMIRSDALDIAQPDAGWVGGISETLKIGAVAKAAGRRISLHCFGSSVLFAASLQVAAAMSNTERIESEENPNPLKTDLVRTPFETDEHMSFLVPQGEGLGIELDWDKVSDFTVEV